MWQKNFKRVSATPMDLPVQGKGKRLILRLQVVAGIGGFRRPRATWWHLYICFEIDREAQSIYAQNFRSMPWGDITEIHHNVSIKGYA